MCCAQRHTKQTDNGLDFGLHLFFVTFSTTNIKTMLTLIYFLFV